MIYVTYKLDTDKGGGEYKILTIDKAYHWIQNGNTNLLRIKDSLKEVNIPEIKKLLEEDRVLELLNQQDECWLITKIIRQ